MAGCHDRVHPGVESSPLRTLLGDRHWNAHATPPCQRRCSDLGQQVVGRYPGPMVLDQPARPEFSACLFVGYGEEDEVARISVFPGCKAFEYRRHCCGLVEHVDGSASPHEPIAAFPGKGINAPAIAIDGNDIGMPHQHEGWSVARSRYPIEDAHSSRMRLAALTGDSEVCIERIDGPHLATRAGCAVVHAGVADQLLEEFGDFTRGDHPGPPDAARRDSFQLRKRV